MIAPQDLRLGNVVLRNGIVVTVENQTFWDVEKYPDQYESIELTQDWLLKFGLKNTETGWEHIYGHSNKISVILFKKFASVGISGPFGLIHVQVKYVNQFQNLTFTLTGEELKIK
ncbi:UNVERIFIED_CONTAM: hypothetical protein POZ17_19830 [Ralstonia mannitolilytica]